MSAILFLSVLSVGVAYQYSLTRAFPSSLFPKSCARNGGRFSSKLHTAELLKMQTDVSIPLRDPAFRNEHHDRQWSLNIENFRGKWTGPTYWYIRQDDNKLDFSRPSQEIPGSCYEVSFPDSETGQWKGSGLRFTEGTKILPLSRATYNSKSLCFQFPGKDGNGGVGGQGSRLLSSTIDPAGKYPHEINFFNQRTRSMVLLVYKVRQTDSGPNVVLDSVAATPFRCQFGCSVGERKRVGSVDALLQSLKGWKGDRLSFGPQTPLDERRRPAGEFDPRLFASAAVSAVLQDNLVFAAPEVIPQGQPFDLVLGCLQTDALFKQITIAFDAQGALTQWIFDEYRPS